MSIWISILLAILPKIIEFLMDWFSKGKTLNAAQAEKLNHAIYQFHQIEDTAVKMGCTAGGVQPPAMAAKSDWPD